QDSRSNDGHYSGCRLDGSRQDAPIGYEEIRDTVLLQFALQLSVSLRHRTHQLIGLICDLDTKHPERTEKDYREANQGDHHGPLDGNLRMLLKPAACSSQQHSEQNACKYQENQVDSICGGSDQANDEYGDEHAPPKPGNLRGHTEGYASPSPFGRAG